MTTTRPDPADPQIAESLRLLDLITETARTTAPVHLLLADEAAAREFAAKAMFQDWRDSWPPAGNEGHYETWDDLNGDHKLSQGYWLAQAATFAPVLAALRALVTCDACDQPDHTTNRCPQPPV